MVSKAKNVSTKQIAKTVKAGKLPAKGAVKKVAVKQKPSKSSGSKSTAPENQPDAGESKKKAVPEKSETKVQEPVVVLKETVEADKSANSAVAEPTEGTMTEASKAETASSTQKPKTPADMLAAAGAVAKEKVEETTAKAVNEPSTSTVSENRPDAENSKPKESETRVQEPVVVLKDTAEVVETANVPVFEPKHQAELDKADVEAKDAEAAEPMELEETGVEVAEPVEVRSCAEGKGENRTTTEAVPENSADKPSDNEPPIRTVEALPTENTVKALPHVQQSTLSEPESTARGPETETEASQMQEQAAGNPTETAVEAQLSDGGVETKTMQEGMLDTLSGWQSVLKCRMCCF